MLASAEEAHGDSARKKLLPWSCAVSDKGTGLKEKSSKLKLRVGGLKRSSLLSLSTDGVSCKD